MPSTRRRAAHQSALHRRSALTTAMAVALACAGCSADGSGSDETGAQSTSTRLSASGPGGSPGASTRPETPDIARTPQEAVHVIALTAADLPAQWSVEESPTDSNIEDDPTFLGLCGSEFLSERRRTMKVPVTGIDPQGDAVLTTEAVSYDHPDGAALALVELRAAYQNCPPDQTFTDVPVSDQTGLAEDRVVVEYTLVEGTVQTVIVQRRGALLSVVLGEARLITFDAARKIFQRMAALTPEAAGEA